MQYTIQDLHVGMYVHFKSLVDVYNYFDLIVFIDKYDIATISFEPNPPHNIEATDYGFELKNFNSDFTLHSVPKETIKLLEQARVRNLIGI